MVGSKKQWKGGSTGFRDSTPMERIHNRFAAMQNGLSLEGYTPPEETAQLYQVASVPQRSLGVGVMVAMYCNPRLSGRVVAIAGEVLSVERGGEIVEVEVSRCKALIPVGAEFVVYGEVKSEPD